MISSNQSSAYPTRSALSPSRSSKIQIPQSPSIILNKPMTRSTSQRETPIATEKHQAQPK